MAGSSTWTQNRIGKIQETTIAWTADSGGTVSSPGNVSTTDLPDRINGILHQVLFEHAGVTTAYDVTITDKNGTDILAGGGGNLATAADVIILPTEADQFPVSNTLLNLNITNAGNVKTGTIHLYCLV